MSTPDPVIAAVELSSALDSYGVQVTRCDARACGHVMLAFEDTAAAEKLVSVIPDGGPGSLQDRAGGGLRSLMELAAQDIPAADDAVQAVFLSTWNWDIYPLLDGSSVLRWVPSVEMTASDAAEMATLLSAEVSGR